jgi:ABC-type dipeptide/oligopeptide/nickel transport system ATPase component
MSKLLLEELKQLETELSQLKKQLFIEMITEGVDDPGILKCIFLAGGPGSGKSYTAKEIFGVGKTSISSVSEGGLKLVNSDTAFEKALKDNGINPKDLGRIEQEDPKMWDIVAGEDNPNSIRNQAKNITKKQQAFYEAGRLGMIIDGTGDEVTKIRDKKKHAEKLGYDCYMIFVNTSLEVAQERNASRDRTLSPELVTKIWKACQNNLGAFQSMFGGNFIIVDNTEYKKYQSKVRDRKSGEIKIVDTAIAQNIQKSINAFLRKPIYNQIGKKWIQTARMLKNANIIK